MSRRTIKCWPYEDGMEFKYAHLKRDGNFTRINKESVWPQVLTSQDTEITEQCKANQWFGNIVTRVPAGTVLLGEIWVPGQPASYVKSALANSEPVSFDCFAVESLPSRTTLFELDALCKLWGLAFAPFEHASLSSSIAEGQCEWDVDVVYRNLVKRYGKDCEGIVFKDANLERWYKWKPVQTIDMVVTGTNDGKGQHLGLIGSLRCSVYHDGNLVEVADVGGMSKADRIRMSVLDEEELFGKVIEAAYQRVESKGRLRHPRFIQFRDDKPALDCTTEQDTDLAAHYAKK